MGMYIGGQKISPIIKVGEINNQDKTITENGTYTADAGYTGLGEVTVDVQGGGDSGGAYLVQVLDYDGSVIKQDHLNTGDTFTLPEPPNHNLFVFQEWSSPVVITNNTVTVTNSDIIIGAVYTTASGLSEFDITLTTTTGLSVTLNMDGTKNWGDGTSDTNTTHTYSTVGNYTITCDGSTMTTSSSQRLFGSTVVYYVKNVRFGNNITSIGAHAFRQCYSLTSVTIPNSVTSIGESLAPHCYSLTTIIIPSSVTSIGKNMSSSSYSLTSVIIPESITSIGDTAFQNCYSFTNITIPEDVTSIGSQAFNNCYSLKSLAIPSSVTSIGSGALQGCYSLTSITLPSSVITIAGNAFTNCHSVIEYDFSNHTAVPTLSNTNAFVNINKICKIKVPTSLESQWKATTNWSTYANYIVGV